MNHEIARIYLGNITLDSDLGNLIASQNHLKVTLNPSDRPKGRILARTEDGIAIGIVKSRDRLLESGDVFETDSKQLLLVRLQTEEILVLDFTAVEGGIAPTRLVYLGHVLGNQHYPIAIAENKIYVPLTTEAKILEQAIEDMKITNLKLTRELKSSTSEIVFSNHSH